MPKESGLKVAAKMLAGLAPDEQKKLISELQKRDPNLTEKIVANMVTIDDLQFLTVKMLQELMREVSEKDFSLALRVASKETVLKILSMLPKRLRESFEEVLSGPPQPKQKVYEAHEKLMSVVKGMVEKGKLVLRSGGEELV